MTGDKSRLLLVGACVIWHADTKDAGKVIEKDWVGVVIKWDNREHNDMATVRKPRTLGHVCAAGTNILFSGCVGMT